ncbi:uncharacterized protein THITE_2114342 [Thermothielavioides terrestris NRRL 8126]|jgi:hypothetical protein|uniref:Uncharacterized protein n=1 Tax=Thermothielavioides terrestris (strain ATCC 38088 / NRRL 8126) TaxID=578455 RepID=G2QZ92_THETT|nr:uncharacterized protein THITE_2114342 [Thermothielavioides terrestris NRRL 8126]AEO66328.1 hypothetical protein THITE_2114342 [Thermothielavioides terrestris NRRL 8126]
MDTLTHTPPLFLSPALPSELLQFVIDRCTYPTTLIICGDRAEFLSTLTQDLREQQQTPPRPADAEPDATPQQATVDPSHPSNPHPDPGLDSGLRHATQPATPPHPNRAEQTSPPSREIRHGGKPHPLLTAPLAQLAVTRHIRTVFIPTVTHLRAFLSVFSVPVEGPPLPGRARIPPAPVRSGRGDGDRGRSRKGGREIDSSSSSSSSSKTGPPLLVVYGFLALHRGTSEWSVQGLGASAAALVEAGRRARLGVVVVEQQQQRQQQRPPVGLEQGGALLTKEALLEERVPVLSGSARRAGGGLQGTGWAGKTVDVGRVLGRWFRFRERQWCQAGTTEG